MKQLISILCLTLVLAGFGVGCKQTANEPPKEVKQTVDESSNEVNQVDNKPVVEGPMQVKASHILVDTEEEAKDLKTQIDEGADFAELAEKYSKCPSGKDGGNLGYFGKDQMVPEFEVVSFSLPVNSVSDPVKTQFGWHLIKVYDQK